MILNEILRKNGGLTKKYGQPFLYGNLHFNVVNACRIWSIDREFREIEDSTYDFHIVKIYFQTSFVISKRIPTFAPS